MVFILGTPHGGIEVRGGLVRVEGPGDHLDSNDAGNLGMRRIHEFLALPDDAELRSLNGSLRGESVPCSLGTTTQPMPHRDRASVRVAMNQMRSCAERQWNCAWRTIPCVCNA